MGARKPYEGFSFIEILNKKAMIPCSGGV